MCYAPNSVEKSAEAILVEAASLIERRAFWGPNTPPTAWAAYLIASNGATGTAAADTALRRELQIPRHRPVNIGIAQWEKDCTPEERATMFRNAKRWL
jgi:hypothetical protein